MECICMMLLRLRSSLSSLLRSQKIPSGTEVKEFPERSRLFKEEDKERRSDRRKSEIWLSRKEEKGTKKYVLYTVYKYCIFVCEINKHHE